MSKTFVPELVSKEGYPLWKRKVEAWKILTTEEKVKQADEENQKNPKTITDTTYER